MHCSAGALLLTPNLGNNCLNSAYIVLLSMYPLSVVAILIVPSFANQQLSSGTFFWVMIAIRTKLPPEADM